MSGSISFNNIPNSIRVPGSYVEFDNSRALRGLNDWPARVLIMGQRLAAGTIAQGVPIRVIDAAQARTYFGRGSNLAHMFEAWFANLSLVEVWGIAMDDVGGGTFATGTITVTGPSTAAGVIALMIGGRRLEVSVASGTAATAIATAISAAINAALDLPVTSSVAAAVVTLTARHRGEIGNAIDVRHSFLATDVLPAGTGLTIVAMASGAQNPVVTTALDAVAETWFTDFVTPWTDATNMAALEARMATNWGPLVQRDGHGWAGLSGAHGTLTTYGAGRNSPNVSIIGMRGSPTPPWEWAAQLASICIPALAIDPARPVQTLQLPTMVAPLISQRFTFQERDLLLRDGISTFRVNDAGQVFVERVISTYQTSPSGAEDISYLDIETVKTLSYIRYDLRTMIALRFPRHKLANDGTAFARGQNVVTPGTLRAEIVARFKQWEAAGLVEGVDQFKQDIIVRRSESDPNRVDALLPPDLVNQFRVLAAQIEFLL
ncbi:MAG: phage tail sheath subtilisin-like domain-containing protein [Roseomonas sp.]|nr:phage tail sheath subtilisin-like domain-containing protein [Roseomonas sp.]